MSVSAVLRSAIVAADKVAVTAPLVIRATALACAALTGSPVNVTASLFKPMIVPALLAL